jgi:molybdopterin synthase catalytic subunit
MQIRLLYFAAVRDCMHRAGETLDVVTGTTAGDLVRQLAASSEELARLLPHLKLARNLRLVSPETSLCDGDELALLPPVAGGAQDGVAGSNIGGGGEDGSLDACMVTTAPLSIEGAMRVVSGPDMGAVALFVGTVRTHGIVSRVVRLEYQAYVPMALRELAAIVDDVRARWPGVRMAVHHRLGSLTVGEVVVVIAAAAPHREQAFAACRAAIERLKQSVPIWKREVGEDDTVWVGNGP